MGDIQTPHKPIGPFRDDNDDISLGRIIVFMVTILGMLIVVEGGYITWWETFKQLPYIMSGNAPLLVNNAVVLIPRTTNGLQLATFGSALIAVAFGLKGWQRMSEAKIAAAG